MSNDKNMWNGVLKQSLLDSNDLYKHSERDYLMSLMVVRVEILDVEI